MLICRFVRDVRAVLYGRVERKRDALFLVVRSLTGNIHSDVLAPTSRCCDVWISSGPAASWEHNGTPAITLRHMGIPLVVLVCYLFTCPCLP